MYAAAGMIVQRQTRVHRTRAPARGRPVAREDLTTSPLMRPRTFLTTGAVVVVVLSGCGSTTTSPLRGPIRAFDQCLRDSGSPLMVTNPTKHTLGSLIFTTTATGPTVGALDWAPSRREAESIAHPPPPNNQLVLVRHRYVAQVTAGLPHKYATEVAACARRLPDAIPSTPG